MQTYVLRRLLALGPVMLVVATVAFVLLHLAPGDPASVIAGPYASAEDVGVSAASSASTSPSWSSSGAGTGGSSRATSGNRSSSGAR